MARGSSGPLRRTSWCFGLILALSALACAPQSAARRTVTLDEFLGGGRARGLTLENPFAVDDSIAAQVEDAVGAGGSVTGRMSRLTRYLSIRTFEYEANKSLTADQAFRERRGDCMAYTNLYLGLCRRLKVPAFFVHINEARNYYEKDGLYFVSSHMAVGCALQYYTVIVDFTEQEAENSMAIYDAVDDATAVGLFYNNVAVDRLMEGDVASAESLLRYLVATLPHLRESRNNLGVVLMRQGRFAEALDVLESALTAFPDYQPLYTNAIQAAKGAGHPDLAGQFETQGRRILARDPFFMFNQGVTRFAAKDLQGALAQFKRIAARQPKSPSLYAWIARTELSMGRTAAGLESFQKAQGLAPYLPMLEALRREFPALGAVPRPPAQETATPSGLEGSESGAPSEPLPPSGR